MHFPVHWYLPILNAYVKRSCLLLQVERKVLKYYYNITLNRSKKIRFLALSTKYIL